MKYTTTEPASLVVSVADCKEHLGLLTDDHNTRLSALSKAAETYFERTTNRFLLTRTVEAYFNDYESVVIKHRPNVELLSLEYYDENGDLQELLTGAYGDDFQVDSVGLDTVLAFEETPTLGDVVNPIVATYTVGYGDADDVPELIKHAIKGLVAHWFWQTTPVITGTISTELPLHVQSILDIYRVYEL